MTAMAAGPTNVVAAGRFEPAGILIRAAAAIIDTIISAVPAVPVGILSAAILGYSTGSIRAAEVGLGAGIYSAVFAYFWFVTAIGGGRGMRTAGLRIVRWEDGAKPGPRVALGRVFLSSLASFAMLALVDYGWALFDPQKRTLHDKLAGTIVVYVD